jgi:hypothetical protein
MSLYTLRPISDRTNFTGRHQRSMFDAPWTTTRALLGRELRALTARSVALEIDVTEADIRLDGEIRANARPASPGIRLAFDSKYGPLMYATDRFTTWQDNVRAIALGLEALRKVDRYGITKRGEQYAGWKALPSGFGDAAAHMTYDEALHLINSLAPPSCANRPLERRIRWAKAHAHPDAPHNGGDRTMWDQVERAAHVLERST